MTYYIRSSLLFGCYDCRERSGKKKKWEQNKLAKVISRVSTRVRSHDREMWSTFLSRLFLRKPLRRISSFYCRVTDVFLGNSRRYQLSGRDKAHRSSSCSEKSRKKWRNSSPLSVGELLSDPNASRINSEGKTINSQRLSVCRDFISLTLLNLHLKPFTQLYLIEGELWAYVVVWFTSLVCDLRKKRKRRKLLICDAQSRSHAFGPCLDCIANNSASQPTRRHKEAVKNNERRRWKIPLICRRAVTREAKEHWFEKSPSVFAQECSW